MTSDLTGGIKNALERKEDIEKIKQSFLNAGYSKEEIEEAMKPEQLQVQPLPQKSEEKVNEKAAQPKNKFPWLTISIIAGLIIIGAALLGLYWDKITSLI